MSNNTMMMRTPVRTSNPSVKQARKRAKKRRTSPTLEAPGTHIIIGNRLRKYYQDVVQQPFPERFTTLLHQLERKLAGQKTH